MGKRAYALVFPFPAGRLPGGIHELGIEQIKINALGHVVESHPHQDGHAEIVRPRLFEHLAYHFAGFVAPAFPQADAFDDTYRPDRSHDDDPYKVPVVPPKAFDDNIKVIIGMAGAPECGSPEYDEWEEKHAAEVLARRKTVTVKDDSVERLFPGDDSLTAVFWRRYLRAEALFRDAMTQFQSNVCSDQEDLSLEWMIRAMVAELRLLYSNDPDFLAALDASQKAWEDYAEKEIALRFPGYPEVMHDYGTSTSTVYHQASIEVSLIRVRELMPWIMGEDSSGGQWIGLGTLCYDDCLALKKETLRARGLWPLKPVNIGIDPTYGDEYLDAFAAVEAERDAEYRTQEDELPETAEPPETSPTK